MNSRAQAARRRASPGPGSGRCRGPRGRRGRRPSGRGSRRGSCATPCAALAAGGGPPPGRRRRRRARAGPAPGSSKPCESAPTRTSTASSPSGSPSSRSTSRRRSARPGVAQEQDAAALRRAAGRRPAPQVAGVAAHRPAGDRQAAAPPGSTSRRSIGRAPRQALQERSSRRAAARRRWSSMRLRVALAGRSAPCRGRRGPPRATASGSSTTVRAPSKCSPGRHRAPGHEAQQVGDLVSVSQAAVEPLQQGGQLAALGEALRQELAQARQRRSGGRRRPRAAAPRPRRSAARVRWVSGSKLRRLSMVSPKNSMRTGSAGSGGKTSRMPPRRATWPAAGDRVLAPVAALVERLEQDLRGHLLAGRAA